MKKIRRVLIMGLLVVALLVPMVVPVMGNPPPALDEASARALYEAYRDAQRRYNELRAEIDSEQQLNNPRPHVISPQIILLEPGEVVDVQIAVRNIGNATAHNFLSTATANEGAPFIIEFINNTNRFDTINQNQQRNMTLRITVDPNAEPGPAEIDLLHRFSNQAGVHSTTTDTVIVRIMGEVEPTGTPTIRLTNFQNSVSNLGPNQSFTLTATLENTGTATANDVRITIANMNAELLILTSDLNAATFAVLEPGESRQVSFSFRTASDIPSSFTTIGFSVAYEGVAANRPVTPAPVTIVAIPEDYATESPNIELRNLSVPTGRLNVGQSGQITFQLANTGDAIARNILVTATSMEAGALVPTTLNRQQLQSLGVGETQSFTFGFMPTSNTQTRNYPVQLRIEYEISGANGESTPFIQYVGLNVYNPEEEDDRDPEDPDHGRMQIPRIIVSTNNLTPQIPRAGQNFEMEITFLNTSSTRSVNNIRITLDAPPPATEGQSGASGGDSVFVPVGGSNTLFVPYLGPGEDITRTITMFTVPDAAPRMYTVRINLDYQDEDYFTHSVMEMISVPVAQDSRLETRPAEIAVTPFMDMFGFVDFQFEIINTGRVNLRNLRVRVDGNFDTSQAQDYLGHLQQGRVATFMGRIFPTEPGFHEGTIVIYAEDDAGEIIEIIHPFAIEVMGGFGDDSWDDSFGDDYWGEGGGRWPSDMEMGDRWPHDEFNGGMWGEDFYGEEEGGVFARIWSFIRKPVFWGPAAGVVVAAIVVVVILVKKKNSRLDFED